MQLKFDYIRSKKRMALEEREEMRRKKEKREENSRENMKKAGVPVQCSAVQCSAVQCSAGMDTHLTVAPSGTTTATATTLADCRVRRKRHLLQTFF